MLGTKKHVLELGNSMAASDAPLEPIQNQPTQTKPKDIAKTMVLANFGPTVTCWVSKSMYLSWESQRKPQISNLNQSKTKTKQTKPKNIAKAIVIANFRPTLTCLVSKSIYLSLGF